MTSKSGLSIGGLSQRTGCNIETIRYYEREKILPEPPRSTGGHRIYDQDHLKRLTFIRRSRQLGFSLDEVRGMLNLIDGGDYTCAEVKKITLDHHTDIRSRIADLQKMARVLKDLASRCDDGSVPECAIIEALFEPNP